MRSNKNHLWLWVKILGVWTILLVISYQLYINTQNDIGGNTKFEYHSMKSRSFMRNHRLLIDDRPSPSEYELIKEIQHELPNLPTTYFEKKDNSNRYFKNKSCAAYPSMYDIEFESTYWQTLRTNNGTFHFLSAYLDNRPNFNENPSVRILTMINRIEATVEIYCHLWFDRVKEPIIVKAMNHTFLWNKSWGGKMQGIYYSYLVTCPVPDQYTIFVPSSVSVVTKPCYMATNNIRVINNKPEEKKKFAVCVKGLDFHYEDLSVKLVEWLELLFLLGVDKVFFYKLQVHPNILEVLKYYEEKGKVDVTPLTLPGGQPNAPIFQHLFMLKKTNLKRRDEILPYNDCLYKNLNSYEYVILLDIDEIIIPVRDSNWNSLMERVKKEADKNKKLYDSYDIRNVYFLDGYQHTHGWFSDIPKYMHMMQHVYRTKNFTKSGYYVKCFHDTQRVLALHNHYPFKCANSSCKTFSVQTKDAQLQHYRSDCVKEMKKSCENFKKESVLDTSVWRYKNDLILNVKKVLGDLDFFD